MVALGNQENRPEFLSLWYWLLLSAFPASTFRLAYFLCHLSEASENRTVLIRKELEPEQVCFFLSWSFRYIHVSTSRNTFFTQTTYTLAINTIICHYYYLQQRCSFVLPSLLKRCIFWCSKCQKSTSSFLTRMFSEKHYWFWLCH